MNNKPISAFLDTGNEKILLNASSADVRDKCIEVFNFSADVSNWWTQGKNL